MEYQCCKIPRKAKHRLANILQESIEENMTHQRLAALKLRSEIEYFVKIALVLILSTVLVVQLEKQLTTTSLDNLC